MTNNFVEQIERYLLGTFFKRDGNFGYKPLVHPNHFSKGEKAHEQLKREGLIYLENERKEAIASIHPKRGITFCALVEDDSVMEECRIWKFTISDKRIDLHAVVPETTKGVAILGKIDLNNVGYGDPEEIFYFDSYDNKCHIELESHRDYPESIYSHITKVEIDEQ